MLLTNQYLPATMRLLSLLCIVLVISAKHSRQEENKGKDAKNDVCDGLEVGGIFYKKEILGIGLNRPYQLAYYKHRREVFFSYNVGKDDEDNFEIGYISDDRKEHKKFEDVKNGFAIAFNEKDHIAYFGGSDGIYRKVLKTNSTVTNVIEKYNIWDMFFKHHLYFITYPSQRLYKYTEKTDSAHKTHKGKADREKWIHEKLYQFAIDGDNDVFITNETGLYMIRNGSEHRHHFHGEKIFRAIEINNKGHAYFCGQNGIYMPIKHNNTLHKIVDIKNIFGLTFDEEDHIIYSDPHQIVKLVPSVCNIVNIKIPGTDIHIHP